MLTYQERGALAERCGSAQTLFCDRAPFAVANISHSDGACPINGRAELFYTPLGMFVRVLVRGLEDGVYSLTLSSGEICIYLPPLYARGGEAWSEALTGKISASEMLHGCINVIEYDSDGGRPVACGNVRSPIVREMELLRAL